MADDQPKRRRLYFVDNLRTLLIILVVVFHLAVTYGASGYWPYREGQPDDLTALVFTLFTAINGTYVIGMFFMIAGYFTPRSYDRKGFGSFLKDRLLRLGIPLLIYILVFDPLIVYAIGVVVHGSQASFWQFLQGYFVDYRGLGVGPMWFVEGLLILTVLYALWRLLPIPVSRWPQPKGNLPGNLAVALFALGLGVVTFVVHVWLPIGWIYEPLGLPIPLFPQYVTLFVVGILAKEMSDSSYAVYFIHALVLVFLALALRGVTLYPLLKFALVAPVAVALCFVLACLLRKLPGVRRIL
jgi:glucan biosynthesis protein C